MASNNGYLTHCRICGTPIFSLGNRQFCSACYAQNRRNAAHRSNAEAKMRREQAKREEEKMKASNKTVTSAQELAMRAKLSEMGGISYGELSLWEMSHGLEFSAWEHEWEKLNGGTNSDGTKFPDGDSKLYDVLMLVVNEKYGPNGTDEATLAKQVGINSSYFCEKKHRAYTALSALLWGCDIESLLSLLSKD